MRDVRGRYLTFQGSPGSHSPAFPAGEQLRLSIPGRRSPLLLHPAEPPSGSLPEGGGSGKQQLSA